MPLDLADNLFSIVEDYRGIPVYSAYRPFDFEGTRWAVLAEQGVAEVAAPAQETFERLAMGYAFIVLLGLFLRYTLLNVVAPATLAAFLGLSMIDSIDEA